MSRFILDISIVVIDMAKAIDYVVELTVEEAKRFLASIGRKNPARDETMRRARKLNIEIR